MQDDLIALAERCEAVPDHVEVVRLNGDILRALGWTSDAAEVYDPASDRRSGIPSYTLSLDAAMTLVPKGLRLMLSEWDDEKHLRSQGPWQAVLSEPGCDASFDAMRGYRCDHAHHPALAICAAALRARATPPKPDRLNGEGE